MHTMEWPHWEVSGSDANDLLPIEIKVDVEGDVAAALSALRGTGGA
ncbi:hypothetical protein GTU99_02385 [Streptomyces sp. PRKS01-65]|nr:hypothetical protein [Streptomyces harenosi]